MKASIAISCFFFHLSSSFSTEAYEECLTKSEEIRTNLRKGNYLLTSAVQDLNKIK